MAKTKKTSLAPLPNPPAPRANSISTTTPDSDLQAAYQALLVEHSQLKQKYEALIHFTPDPAKLPAPSIPIETFTVDGAKYQMAAAKIAVRGVGNRTALECLVDDTLYPLLNNLTIVQWLVYNRSTAIKKVS